MYRLKSDGSLKTQGEIRQMNPNTSFPRIWTQDVLDALGIDPIFESPQPTLGRYEIASKDGVELVAGKWVWKWVIGPTFKDYTDDAGVVHTAAEQEAAYKASKDAEQAKNIRATRDKLLSDCDWTQVEDAPVDKAAWATYRQALRNVPQQIDFPWDVQWPNKPE